jgi:hypothetical protein
MVQLGEPTTMPALPPASPVLPSSTCALSMARGVARASASASRTDKPPRQSR